MTAMLIPFPANASGIAHHFAGVSHFPDRRATMEKEGLTRRLKEIEARADELNAMPGAVTCSHDLVEALKDRHKRATVRYWASIGRTMSPMVVGPARFPVERNRKRLRICDQRAEAVAEDHKRALRTLESLAFPWGLPGAPISSDDPDAIAKLTARVAQVKGSWELTKQASAFARRGDWSGLAKLTSVQEALRVQRRVRDGFSAYNLAGFSAEVRRLEQRIDSLKAAGTRETSQEETPAGVELIHNAEANRVQLRFPAKPEAETIAQLKSRGFRFSPSQGVWQRMLNNAGVHAAREILRSMEHGA